MCKCGSSEFYIAIREMERQREMREGGIHVGVFVSACIRGVSRFNRSHVGRLFRC